MNDIDLIQRNQVTIMLALAGVLTLVARSRSGVLQADLLAHAKQTEEFLAFKLKPVAPTFVQATVAELEKKADHGNVT